MFDFLRRRIAARSFESYLVGRQKLAERDYDVELYRTLIAGLTRSSKTLIEPFLSRRKPERHISRFFIRHDVDTAAYLRRLPGQS